MFDIKFRHFNMCTIYLVGVTGTLTTNFVFGASVLFLMSIKLLTKRQWCTMSNVNGFNANTNIKMSTSQIR